jgi:hypothetical protein
MFDNFILSGNLLGCYKTGISTLTKTKARINPEMEKTTATIMQSDDFDKLTKDSLTERIDNLSNMVWDALVLAENFNRSNPNPRAHVTPTISTTIKFSLKFSV